MSMTSSEREKCQWIIHSHAAAAAAGNLVPVPGLGVAADTITMTTMAMALAGIFGSSITESVAKNMAINAIKKTMLKSPIKTAAKELSKLIPGLGQVVAPSISVTMLESAGWVLAEELANKRGKLNVSNSNKESSYKYVQKTDYSAMRNSNTLYNSNNLSREQAEELYHYAQNYYYGLNGFEQNENEARKFYTKAANAGNEDAKLKLQYFF